MIISKNSILYFSGTGNTYEMSIKIGEKCGFELINMASLMKEEVIEINCGIIGITFPVYYGGFPRIVSQMISKIRSLEQVYIFALATYGGMPGNPFEILDRKLKEKDLSLGAGFLINMPGNYLPVNGARRSSIQMKCFKRADHKVKEIIEIIMARRVLKYEKSPYIIDRPFSSLSEKRIEGLASLDVNFHVTDQCEGCGICLKICPTKNISNDSGKLEWLGKCEQCMACIQYCPKEAIQYGHKTLSKKRYQNPNVDYLKILIDIEE